MGFNLEVCFALKTPFPNRKWGKMERFLVRVSSLPGPCEACHQVNGNSLGVTQHLCQIIFTVDFEFLLHWSELIAVRSLSNLRRFKRGNSFRREPLHSLKNALLQCSFRGQAGLLLPDDRKTIICAWSHLVAEFHTKFTKSLTNVGNVPFKY